MYTTTVKQHCDLKWDTRAGHGLLVQVHPECTSAHPVPVGRDEFTIGSSPLNRLLLEGEYIDEQHAVIEFEADWYVVRDCDSQFGTFVNEQRVYSSRLQSGDKLRVGSHSFRFFAGENAEKELREWEMLRHEIDGLTELFTKQHLANVLCRAINPFSLDLIHKPMAVLRWTNWNITQQRYGKIAVDTVLTDLAYRIQQAITKEELAARLAPHAFAFSHRTELEYDANQLLERVLHRVNGPIDFDCERLDVVLEGSVIPVPLTCKADVRATLDRLSEELA